MAAELTIPKFRVLNGPSKFDLMVAFFDGNHSVRSVPWFGFSYGATKQGFFCLVESIAHPEERHELRRDEDTWLIEVRVRAKDAFLDGCGFLCDGKLRGWYSTQTRKGEMEFIRGE